ncbi:hypothetical protein [Streptomyces sp. NPDC101776]|uniref:hypothetical protein n=1 Tax=Streptomyces sp. NPDC101776 TaxID=3366146 RepID=UPI0037F8E9E4
MRRVARRRGAEFSGGTIDLRWAEFSGPPETLEDHGQGDTVTRGKEQAARGRTRVQRMNALMRKHIKAELLRMVYADGLVNHNSPEKWRKDEIASVVVDQEFRAAAAQPPAPAKRSPEQHHHDECDKTMYEGGACTCDLIDQYGPPSEREDSY